MYFILEFYLLLSILFFFLFGISNAYSSNIRFPNIESSLLSLVFIIIANSIYLCLNNSFLELVLFNNLITKDSSNNLVSLLLLLINLIVILVTRYYNKTLYIISFEFLFLVLFLTFNSILLVSVNNLFLFFLLLESQSITLFILSSINKRSRYSIESSLKYFILGSFSSIIMLLGISMVYITTSFMFFDDLIVFFSSIDSVFLNTGVSFALIFISVGFFFKLYSAPFHFWVSDIYEGSASSSVLLFASSSFFVFYYMFIKLFFVVFYKFFNFYSNYLIVFAICSMIFGTLGGLLQIRLKRLLAYSSITVTGYIFLILFSESLYSIESVLFFILVYITISIGMFTIVTNLLLDNSHYVSFFTQISSLVNSNRVLSFFFTTFLFSVGGIPPFVGFIAKLELLVALILKNAYLLFFVFLVISVVSLFYYVRVVKYVFSKKISYWVSFKQINYTSSLVISFIFLINIISVLFNSTYFLFCKLLTLNLILL